MCADSKRNCSAFKKQAALLGSYKHVYTCPSILIHYTYICVYMCIYIDVYVRDNFDANLNVRWMCKHMHKHKYTH